MRVGLWRLLTCLPVLVAAVATAEPADPPVAPAPADAKGLDTAAERAKLQAELLAALKRMSATPSPMSYPTGPGPGAPASPKTKTESSTAKGPDPIREGMNLFRDNDFEAARRTFQLIDPITLPKEDRAFVRYMLASSLRRLGKPSEAEAIYREVANSGDDEFLASYASQQLYLIGSERELQTQLEQLRARAKSK